MLYYIRANSLVLLSAFLSLETIEQQVYDKLKVHYRKNNSQNKQDSDGSAEYSSSSSSDSTSIVSDHVIRKKIRRIFRENILNNLKTFNISDPLRVN